MDPFLVVVILSCIVPISVARVGWYPTADGIRPSRADTCKTKQHNSTLSNCTLTVQNQPSSENERNNILVQLRVKNDVKQQRSKPNVEVPYNRVGLLLYILYPRADDH